MKTEKAVLEKWRAAHHAALASLATTGADGKTLWRKLARLEKFSHAAATAKCNGECFLTYDFLHRPEAASDRVEDYVTGEITRIFGTVPQGFFMNWDARGYALKLDPDNTTIPEGMQTDWGRNGILAAIIN